MSQVLEKDLPLSEVSMTRLANGDVLITEKFHQARGGIDSRSYQIPEDVFCRACKALEKDTPLSEVAVIELPNEDLLITETFPQVRDGINSRSYQMPADVFRRACKLLEMGGQK